LTLAPTLYAGFITAGFDQIGDEINSRLSDCGYSEKAMQMIPEIDSSEVSSLQEQIERIPVPEVKTAISDAIHASVASGYDHLYAAAAVVSLLVIAAISIPAFRRQKR
ncbi:MFS transporter, partial [Bacillus subtilis]|nr:MFS transporter [Bacillus subtilis]